MSISSPGIGSGLDIGSLITQLVAAEGAAKTSRLNLREAEYQADVSAYGALKSALSIFQSSVEDLQTLSDFQARKATSSNEEVFTVTANETADASQFGIEVVQLAKAHKFITNDGFTSVEAVGAGTLTLTQGSDSFAITVSATDTVTDVRDAINAATDNTGIVASVINVDDGLGGTESKLVFTASETGLDNAITITANDDDLNNTDNLGLSRLVNANLTETSEALDGQIRVDGQLVTNSTNSFNSVITGVTINAVGVGAGETLTVSTDKEAVKSKINDFVTNYNGLLDTFSALGSFNGSTEAAGILIGDSTLRGVENLIRREISSSVDGLTSTFSTLAEIGITTGEDGKLSVNDSELDTAMDESFDQIGELFASESGLSNNLDSILDQYVSSSGVIDSKTDGIQTRLDDIAEQREALDRRLEAVERRLLAQFTTLDKLVNSLTNQSNFLTQQLANLPGSIDPNKSN